MPRSGDRKSIFITGAASGMGRETALLFARQGWFVGAFDVNRSGLDALEAEIGAGHGHFALLDVTSADDFAAAIADFSDATGGKLDILMNNAGIAIEGLFDEISWDDVMKVINVNLLGVMIGIRAGLPLLRATPGSLCLTTSSSSAIWGTGGIAVYSATKHAVRGLTEALSVEFQRFGVRAADLLPGLIDTPILGDAMREMAPKEGMWRITPASEVAEAAWQAYHDNQLHWYVPAELKDFDLEVTSTPEKVRDERARMFGFVQ
ncbi:MAG: SDR family oxidoreductase [Sphingomonadaceae bacterium]|nr:SDR family oxidoreductase [Sphingomonadaceae bacterium]